MTDLLGRRQVIRGALAALGANAAFGAPAVADPADAKLRLQGIWTNDPEAIGYFIAIDEGKYAAEHLAVQYLPGGPDLIPEGSLLAGKADIALLSVINAAQAVYAKGAAFRIIGAQFQINPDAVVSLASSGIRGARDLRGKIVACPPLGLLTFKAMLRLAGVPLSSVHIVPYAFDPTPLVSGNVDAVVDYMTLLPWVVEKSSGKKASYFFLADAGMPLYSNVVTVSLDTLQNRRRDLVGFLRASRAGWERNFRDPNLYPAKFQDDWFKGTGLGLDAMRAQNIAQKQLMLSPHGLFALDDALIEKNLHTLHAVGIKAGRELFDPSLLAEL